MSFQNILPPEVQPRPGMLGRAAQRAISLLLLVLTHAAFSAEAPQSPSTRAMLSVKWSGDEIRLQVYDMQALEKLPKKEIVTALPGIFGNPKRHRWEGIPLMHFLGKTGALQYSSIRFFALNAYSVDIPIEDIQKYDPILAYRRDGKPMSVREKGPLIVIYPFDKFPALHDQQHVNRTAWQVHEALVR